jgi:predicted dehydrogenase
LSAGRHLVGLVGCGDWGRHILRDLVELGAVVHVVARSEASRERARAGGAASIVGRVDQLPAVGAYVVATTVSTHAEVAADCLSSGRPVFCQKPLTADPVSARALADAAGDRLFVMDLWRHHPGVEALAAMVRDGRYGAVRAVELERLGWGCAHPDVDPVWVLAPHDLSIVQELLGALPAPVAARADRARGLACGLVALLGDEPWVSVAVSSRAPERRRRVRVLFEDAVAELGGAYVDHVTVHPGGDRLDPTVPEPQLVAVSTELPLRRQLAAFLGHLDGGPPPRSRGTDAAHAVEVLGDLRRMAGI